jgi:phenylalanyl-tRNA synthetase alpha chain
LDSSSVVASLSEIEKKTLGALEKERGKNAWEIAKEAGLPIDSVRRALQWLREKGLIGLKEHKKEGIGLTAMGKSSLNNRFPEEIFIETLHALGGNAALGRVREKSQLNQPEFNAAMGLAKKNAWVSIRKIGGEAQLELTGLEKPLLEGKYALRLAAKNLESGLPASENEKRELLRRGLACSLVSVGRTARLNARGEKALQELANTKGRAFNIFGDVPKLFIGKKQPYVQFLEQIRARLVSLGFREMPSPLITQEFYNFDVLFQPQNHPARDWSDTYQLKQPRVGKLPDKKIVARIKAAHENGWKTGSVGWGYNWSERIARRLMPTAHGTAHSARQLVNGIEVPGKYFAIARCYRPDVVDSRHLVEFNQMEGFVVDKAFNFRHLLGMLKQFATEIAGAEKVKFFPDYYPFTEPSVQLSAKHPKLGWIEFAGAGIFRPEMTIPLGVKEPVLAWGVGVDRLAMFKLGVKDIRYLFAQDLEWLRNSRAVRL